MKTFLIRGVPAKLQRDGWWLNEPAPEQGQGADGTQHRPQNWRAGLLAVLIAMGDVLIWQVIPGLSLALFCAILIGAAIAAGARRIAPRQLALIAALTLLAVLPLVELVQPLSILIACVGVSVVLALIAGLAPRALLRGALRLWPLGMRQTVMDSRQLLRGGGQSDPRVGERFSQALYAWFMPVTLGLAFVLLLLAANPVAEHWLAKAAEVDVQLPGMARIGFWLCLLPLVWTPLALSALASRLQAAPPVPRQGPARRGMLNPASVVRALMLFNAVFAVQTLLDLVYLYGGLGLPEGITYAEYAHRGAYPLVVTALLAGGFAILTRPWVQGNALLRGLLMLWVAQNVALVVSSLVRLEMYVDAYGLTHLRMAAAIWMALTAAGLGLILWQVWRQRDTGWLMLRGGALGAVTLYICAFVSFDATVARYNLGHAHLHQSQWDAPYLCGLGDAAKPVILAHAQASGQAICLPHQMQVAAPADWREWGFRNARARTSLAALQPKVQP